MLLRRCSRLTRPSKAFLGTQRRLYHFERDVLDELSSRGLTSEITRPAQLALHLNKQTRTVYLGIDATASALHIGHLVPFMCLLYFQLFGHRVLSVIGGGTGRVGDPSGKDAERDPIERSRILYNTEEIHKNILQFFTKARSYADSRLGVPKRTIQPFEILNNAAWLEDQNLIHFLATIGKRARVNTMLQRESVQRRLNSQQGISFTEFTYQLLQAYDFYHLYRNIECTVQLGGSDQYGNIVAGLDLIRGTPHPDAEDGQSVAAYGITTPLLTTASGGKFGKTEGNAIWLDEKKTSVFDFYQHFVRTADTDIYTQLKMFTLLPLSRIDEAMVLHYQNPEKRTAQRLLADEVTELVHGVEGVQRAHMATDILFGIRESPPRAEDVVTALDNDPRLVFCEESQIINEPITKVVSTFNLVASRAEAHRLAEAKGLYLNGQSVPAQHKLQWKDMIDGKVAIIRAGKDNHLVLALEKTLKGHVS